MGFYFFNESKNRSVFDLRKFALLFLAAMLIISMFVPLLSFVMN